jgi:excisionase family DNA binding protein
MPVASKKRTQPTRTRAANVHALLTKPSEPPAVRPSKIDGVEKLTLGVAQGAAASGLSKRFLWDEIKAGRLRTVRIGRRVLIPVGALKEFLKLS